MPTEDIIERIKFGDQSELKKIYEQYRKEFLSWIIKEYNCSEEDGKDIYQLAILVFYDNIRQGKLQYLVSTAKTYLFGVAKNIYMQQLRKAKKLSSIDQEKWIKNHVAEVDDEDDNTDLLLEKARNALSKLGSPCQQVIKMFYYEKKSMEELTQILGYKNAETAKNQKCKCMKRLRRLFNEEQSRKLIYNDGSTE